MSTMEQARQADVAPDTADLGAAVEEQMAKIVTELGAALGVLLTSLGTRSGLWAALAGAGPLTTAEVAAKVSVEPSLVREWLRAQAAGGYLDYDPATGTFTLPDAVAAVDLRRPRRSAGRRGGHHVLLDGRGFPGASARRSAAGRASGGISAPPSTGTARTPSPGSPCRAT